MTLSPLESKLLDAVHTTAMAGEFYVLPLDDANRKLMASRIAAALQPVTEIELLTVNVEMSSPGEIDVQIVYRTADNLRRQMRIRLPE